MPDVPTTYRFSIGPWNISEGRDPYGPETRPAKDFAWKLEQFKKGGFDAVMFHDDDVVPDIDSKSRQQVLKEAKQVRKMVEDAGMFVELVAPRLWVSSATIDGASSWAVFRRIVVPLSAAPLVTLAVVNLLWVWNELLIALVFLQDDSKKTLMVGITGFQSRYNLNVPAIMAGLTLATLPIVTFYLFGQRFFVKGLISGAAKGE